MNKQIYINKEEEYRLHPGVNVSKLKLLEKGVDKYKEEKDKSLSSPSIIIGKVVDTLLTDTTESFGNKYIILNGDVEVPTEKILYIISSLYETIKEVSDDVSERMLDYENYLRDILENTDWYQNRKIETRLADVVRYSDYFRFLVKAEGKTVLSEEIFKTASIAAESIKNNETTKEYFCEESIKDGIHIFYQLPIFFEILNKDPQNSMAAKALLDFVIVDTNNKLIRGGDLKTMTEPCIKFKENVISYRYDLQAAFYSEALSYAINSNLDIFGIDLTDYKLHNSFLFVVESTKYPGNPVVFESDETVVSSGIYGRRSADGKYVYSKGFLELLDEMSYLRKIDFMADKVIHENKNRLVLSL